MSTTMDQIHHIRDMFYRQDKNILEFPQFYPQTSDFAPLIINNFMKMPKI